MALLTSNKLKEYTFVLCFTADCCGQPHLWVETLTARTRTEAKKRLLSTVYENGMREPHEIVEIQKAKGKIEACTME